MAHRSEQLQIRVTPREKAVLKRLARASGQDVSAFVLARALPSETGRFASIMDALRDDSNRRFALAELNDVLSSLTPMEFEDAVGAIEVEGLSPLVQNYVAAMVEQAARAKCISTPEWTHDIAPLEVPYFATSLKSLRLYLLRATPIAFKRRNIFADAGIGSRV
ncbi:MAG: plasmid mobilization protein [Gemmatimonadaceae bacterium]